MRPWQKTLLILAILILAPLAAFAYWSHLLSPMSATASAKPIRVDIPNGAGAAKIADKLHAAKLIRNEFAFVTMARVLGESQEMKAGLYEISPRHGVIEIINKLVAGDAVAQWVTIPEGLTLEQIAARLQTRRLANADTFVRLAHRRPKRLGLNIPVSRRSVDGYLMPETYQFQSKASEAQILRSMLATWNEKVLRPNAALFRASDLPMDKIVVLASLIEREAKVPQDRGKISSVIRNRLKRKMKLEIDATVIYALGSHKEKLTFKDLKVKSPYNTYYAFGLPPGPICNPGLSSIEAALKPAKTPYLFYVAQPDGSHLFAATFEEHKANIARVKQMRSASVGSGRS